MNDNNLSDLGRELSDTVQRAIQSGDYSQIKNTVNKTMKTVVDQTVSVGKQASETVKRTVYDSRSVYQQQHAQRQRYTYQTPPKVSQNYHQPVQQYRTVYAPPPMNMLDKSRQWRKCFAHRDRAVDRSLYFWCSNGAGTYFDRKYGVYFNF